SICTLADALAACEHSAPSLGVNVEIKSSRDEPDHDPAYWVCEATVAQLEQTPVARVLVSSFDVRAIDRLHELDPTIATGLLTATGAGRGEKVVRLAADRGHVALNPYDACTTPALVDVAHDAGLAVNVWTVDDPDRMRSLAAMGVDAIITNVPDV